MKYKIQTRFAKTVDMIHLANTERYMGKRSILALSAHKTFCYTILTIISRAFDVLTKSNAKIHRRILA